MYRPNLLVVVLTDRLMVTEMFALQMILQHEAEGDDDDFYANEEEEEEYDYGDDDDDYNDGPLGSFSTCRR